VTRGQLPQRARLPGLNGGGAAAAVPLNRCWNTKVPRHLRTTENSLIIYSRVTHRDALYDSQLLQSKRM